MKEIVNFRILGRSVNRYQEGNLAGELNECWNNTLILRATLNLKSETWERISRKLFLILFPFREYVKRSFLSTSFIFCNIYYRVCIFRDCRVKASASLQLYLHFLHFGTLSEYERYVWSQEVGTPYCLNIAECQGIYVAYVYGFRRIPVSKQARCLVQVYIRRHTADPEWVRYNTRVYAHACANVNSGISVPLVYVCTKDTCHGIYAIWD